MKKFLRYYVILLAYLLCSSDYLFCQSDKINKDFDIASLYEEAWIDRVDLYSSNKNKMSFSIDTRAKGFGLQASYRNFGIKVFPYPGVHFEGMTGFKYFYIRGNYKQYDDLEYIITSSDTESEKAAKDRYNGEKISSSVSRHYEAEIGGILSADYSGNGFDLTYFDYFSTQYSSKSNKSIGFIFSTKYFYDSFQCNDGLIPDSERGNYSDIGNLEKIESQSIRFSVMPMFQLRWFVVGMGVDWTYQSGNFDVGKSIIRKTNKYTGANSFFLKLAPSSDSLYLAFTLSYEKGFEYEIEENVNLLKSLWLLEAKVGCRF